MLLPYSMKGYSYSTQGSGTAWIDAFSASADAGSVRMRFDSGRERLRAETNRNFRLEASPPLALPRMPLATVTASPLCTRMCCWRINHRRSD